MIPHLVVLYPGDGRKITHHIIEEAEQDHVQEPVMALHRAFVLYTKAHC